MNVTLGIVNIVLVFGVLFIGLAHVGVFVNAELADELKTAGSGTNTSEDNFGFLNVSALLCFAFVDALTIL
tara:strand:- start:143 stop:355 length:213 start_codon:yes stop_codon:yes gene_type:complete